MLDYASKDDQGKGTGLVFMGTDGGIIYGLAVLLTVLRPFSFNIFYAGLAAPIILLAILTPFMIIEPPDV